jgi:aconitase A
MSGSTGSNLVGMGVLPLQFKNGQSALSIGLDGTETFGILGLDGAAGPPRPGCNYAGNTGRRLKH